MALGLIGMISVSQIAKGSWTRKADMPTARFGLTSSVVNGKIYAIGGATAPRIDLRTVEEYDPVTDSWKRKADIPTTRCWHSSSVVNGKIYVIGGYVGAVSAIVEQYDPVTDTWTRKADMSIGRAFHVSSVVNGKIYVIGGLDRSEITTPTVEEYDPSTDTWVRKADMLTARASTSCSTIDGIIYVIGGSRSLGGLLLSTVEAYSPATDTWTSKMDMLRARGFFASSVLNGKIYAIGGTSDPYNSGTFSSMEAYNPAMDTWMKMDDMPTPRKALATSVVNGKIYAIGGNSASAFNSCISTVEEYELIPLPPDFNGDGLVDIKDLLRLIRSWGQDDPMVDIAPPPFGDGIVDVLDLELLMSYWEKPVDDPTLIAHWALDETEGTVAYDSASQNDAFLVGGPVWQPDGGKVGGALAFDGVDDHAVAQSGLNPADGPFSVLAWIKDGAPGQVVISQLNGANWLGADPAQGCLTTELCASGRGAGPLLSGTLITDGDWHRIGFVWDGSYRTLYVDDILAAEDTQKALAGAVGGLNIGRGTNPPAGTFWSGLIDEIRIYNRAVSP